MSANDLDVEANADEQDILLVANELCADATADKDAVILVTDQGVPYGHLDVDTDEAVASVLSAKLEFDEALLHEDMVLQYRVQTEVEEEIRGEEVVGGGQGERDEMVVAQTVEESVVACTSSVSSKEHFPSNSTAEVPGNDSSDDDCGGNDNMDHYLNFSRTVVLQEAPKDVAQTGLSCLPTSGTISQLDGADNESESDTGEMTGEEESQETGRSSQNQESEPSTETSSSEGHDSAATSSANRFVLAESSSEIGLAQDSTEGDSSTDSVSMDEGMTLPTSTPEPAVKQPPVKIRPFSNPRVRLIETTSAPAHLTLTAPVASARQPRKKVVKITTAAPVGRPRTIIPAASSPVFRAVPLKDPITSAPIVINGFGSTAQRSETPKGKPIAIRLTAPKQPTEQQPHQQGGVASGTSQTPQILLVNRFGQILVKDPRNNTFQSPGAASPSLNNISQIAKIIHNRNVLPRPVPKILVAPVSTQSTVVPHSVGVTTHIISYTSRPGSAGPTNVCVRKLNMPGAASLAQQRAQSQSVKPSAVRIKNVTIPLNGQSQAELAQSIIDKAMASHRDVPGTPKLSPSQFTVHPFLNKLESPQPIVTPPTELRRTRPAILTRSAPRSAPQVRVKRVSSVCERVGVKRCRTDFLPPTPPIAVEDPSTAASRFEIFSLLGCIIFKF